MKLKRDIENTKESRISLDQQQLTDNSHNILPNKNQGKHVAKIDINNPETLIMDYLYKKQLVRSYETFRGEKTEKPNSGPVGEQYAEKSFLDVIFKIFLFGILYKNLYF